MADEKKRLVLVVDQGGHQVEVEIKAVLYPQVIRWRDQLFVIRNRDDQDNPLYFPASIRGINWDPDADGIYRE